MTLEQLLKIEAYKAVEPNHDDWWKDVLLLLVPTLITFKEFANMAGEL